MQDILNRMLINAWMFTPKLLTGIAVFLAFYIAAVVARRVLFHIAENMDDEKRSIMKLAANTSKCTLCAFGLLSALGTLGINITALVAGLGLTGFALGYAFKDAVSNFLAGLLILFYRPFGRKDKIKVSGFEGIVTEINLRYTILQSESNSVLIPNSTLFTNAIVVFDTLKKPEEKEE